ncbi:SH3 domain-containing protein [Brevibacterium salitolerans]|uniref:SH3 domain-containing protein n=1 Tax=Brevibacterium salitolerans TaxID=1403566 RepID=A0ABN2WZ89_9MICO
MQVGDRDEEWPAFVFVIAANGSGWVPSRFIDIDGQTGVVREGYDTTELPARKGEYVEVLRDDAESRWSWCRNGDGREGWIPHKVLGIS